jgi:hypothetical protein
LVADLAKDVYNSLKRKDSMKLISQRKLSMQVKLKEVVSQKMKYLMDQKMAGYIIKSSDERRSKIKLL